MCCLTHSERDHDDDISGVKYSRADSEHLRCRCRFGNPCNREQSGPDLLCDWCRGRNHQEACAEINNRRYAGINAGRARYDEGGFIQYDEAWPVK